MPVFTSYEMMQQAGISSTGVSLPLESHMQRVLAMDDVNGLVIDPGEKCFFLEKTVIEDILRIFTGGKERAEYAE